MEEKFVFTGKAKKQILTTIGVGIVLLILGILFVNIDPGHHGAGHEGGGHGEEGGHHMSYWALRLIKGIWHNNVYFTGLSLISVFFLAFNYVAWAGWGVTIKRIPEAIGSFLPVMAVLTIVTFLLFHHDLFHWTHESAQKTDPLIAGKMPYLNLPFYITRMVLYFVLWIVFWFFLRTYSVKEDLTGDIKWYDKSVVLSAGFLVVFGITSSTSAWDWVMSIDPHFFSTMFGWYVFSSWFVSGLAVITLVVIFLREAGFLKLVNDNHIHDLGKFLFAFSVFWTYIWFAQFLLIYYANIPEESVYFYERLKNDTYTPVFFSNLIINFFLPFLILMTREAKRQTIIIKIVAILILIGHWLDFYMMITPPVLGDLGGLDYKILFMELGLTLIYAGAFVFVILRTLSKASLIPKNHPMLQESVHHHVY